MQEDAMDILPEDLQELLKTDTAAAAAELACDDWDNEYNCSYSADGTRLLDAENFPGTVKVREGTEIICDNVFSFQDYMAEDRPLGSIVPEDERVSFLDKICLSSSVRHIGSGAFRECGWLKRLRLPKSLLTIGDEAFYGCWELRQIGFPASLRSVGERAFFECFSLEKIRIDKGLQVIGAEAFRFCESLKEITLPEGLLAIGPDAFSDCRKLRKIYVPEGTADMYKDILPSDRHKYIREIRRRVRNRI